MTDEATDQAVEQSVTDKIASKFGFPGQSEETPETELETGEEGSDLAELDWEGEKYHVPLKLKDAFMRNEDYTRKTQDLAEQRRALQHVEEIGKQSALTQAFQASVAQEEQQLHVIDAYLQQARKVDLSQMNTEQMLRHKVEIDTVNEQRAAIVQALGDKRGKFEADVKAKMVELRGKSRELASKAIQGFSEKTESEMRSFALAEGLTESEIDNVLLDPRSYKVIWKAMQFDKVQANTGKASDAVTKTERVLKPGVAGERMSATTAAKLNFNKAMKAAGSNSAAKARVIEQRLSGVFAKRT